MKIAIDKNKLRYDMQKLNLGIAELAKLVNRSERTIQRIFNGDDPVSDELFTRVADILGRDRREYDIEFNRVGIVKRWSERLFDQRLRLTANPALDYDMHLNARLILHGTTVNVNGHKEFTGRNQMQIALKCFRSSFSRFERIQWEMIADPDKSEVCLHSPKIHLRDSKKQLSPRGWVTLIHFRGPKISVIEFILGESFDGMAAILPTKPQDDRQTAGWMCLA